MASIPALTRMASLERKLDGLADMANAIKALTVVDPGARKGRYGGYEMTATPFTVASWPRGDASKFSFAKFLAGWSATTNARRVGHR